MARTNIGRASIYFMMLVSGIIAQDMDNILDIRCDMKGLIAGSPVTLQNLCGDNFQVIVNGVTNNVETFPNESFPWKLELNLITDATNPSDIIKSTKIVQIEQSMLQNGDNITSIITDYLDVSLGDPEFQVPAGKCDNRDGKGIMRLYSEEPGFDKEYFSKGFFRVLCDFSGVDLMLAVHTSTSEPYPGDIATLSPIVIYTDISNASSDLYHTTELSNIKIMVEGDIPLLDPADTCIFAVAFLTKENVTHQNCTEMGSETHVPEITYYDILLGIPFCLSNGNTDVDLLEMVKESTENIGLCGEYTLVIQVDPMHTLHNEMAKCNNYLTFAIYFSCYMPNGGMAPGGCELMMSPFGSPRHELFDTRFIYHRKDYDNMNYETHHDIRMYRQENRSWIQIYDDHTGLQTKGYGLFKVYNRYMASQDIESTCTDLVTDSDLQNAISKLEGLNDVLLAANKGFDMDTLVPGYITAKGKIGQLNASKDYIGIVSELKTMVSSMVKPDGSLPFNTHVKVKVARSAMNATVELANALMSGLQEMEIKMHVQKHACETSGWLEYMPMVLMWLNDNYNTETQKYGKETLMYVIGNLTATTLHMHYLYPEFTCIEDLLVNMLHYVEEWSQVSPEEKHSVDLDWMYDVDQVRDVNDVGDEKLAFSGCHRRVNQCVRKLQTQCFTDPMSTMTPVVDSKHGVCTARYMKQQTEKHFRILGLQKHKQRMISRDMDDECRNDPIAPNRGPLILWKMENGHVNYGHGQVIFKGMPTLDNSNIMWQKVAMCNCEICHGNVKRRRRR